MSELPIVCALDGSQLHQRREDLLARLAAAASHCEPVEHGLLLRLDPQTELALLWQVLEAERQCCRFLRFRVTLEPGLGPIAVEITGPAGTREFLESTLGL